jgi:hypothetical protein
MPRIVVAGDLIEDFNVVRAPATATRHHQRAARGLVDRQKGGAWFLAKMIRLGCRDLLKGQLELYEPADGNPFARDQPWVSHCHSIWEPHERTASDSKKSVWRIKEFLGCTVPADPAGVCAGRCEATDVDLVVLDDLNLGFRDQSDLWPSALCEGRPPKRVILKTDPPFGQGPLWDYLLSRHRERLTVVISAAGLRAQRARISEGLSWDETIEDTRHEFEHGVSARDLAQCRRVIVRFGASGAASFTRGPLPFGPPGDNEDLATERMRFERCLYLPDEPEGLFSTEHPGAITGAGSILAAALVRHELSPDKTPLFIALGRGLAAIRAHHIAGAGSVDGDLDFAAAHKAVGVALVGAPDPESEKVAEPASIFSSAFPEEALEGGQAAVSGRLSRATRNSGSVVRRGVRSDLLGDLTGAGYEYVYAKAAEVVIRGADAALAAAPKARYEKYLTVDREEIERINAIRRLIEGYRQILRPERPLSLAVFGPPGAGKSFAIKQLAVTLFGKKYPMLEFNLSQLQDHRELYAAFHQVRDESLKGQPPLVFWDEFDAKGLDWLKHFLAPMQDAKFRESGIEHGFGPAIFIFAGGTSSSLEAFDRASDPDHKVRHEFRSAKGPDFVSRLRGYLNVKGPNPMSFASASRTGDESHRPIPWAVRANEDVAHLIRRAVLLRAQIERVADHLIGPDGLAAVSAGVLRAFLRVREYRHGARSLETIVATSSLSRSHEFASSNLPPVGSLSMHASDDFIELIREGEVAGSVVELLAERCHEAWQTVKLKDGWRWGKERDDDGKIHPRLKSYARLEELEKEDNRLTARYSVAKLAELGYRIVARSAVDSDSRLDLCEDEVKTLMRIEHDIWMRDHLLRGYEWARSTRENVRLHADVAPFDAVPEKDQELDEAIGRVIVPTLWERGYRIVKPLRVGVVGHRFLDEVEKVQQGIIDALAYIEKKFPERPVEVVSALAEGADSLVARCVLARQRAQLVVVLPLRMREYEKDFDKQESLEGFRRLVEQAAEVIHVDSQASRLEAYREAGRQVVARANVLVAVWDGQKDNETARVVDEARARKKPIAWVYAGNRKPDTSEPTSPDGQGSVTFENFNSRRR